MMNQQDRSTVLLEKTLDKLTDNTSRLATARAVYISRRKWLRRQWSKATDKELRGKYRTALAATDGFIKTLTEIINS